jgi:hypothetical protein
MWGVPCWAPALPRNLVTNGEKHSSLIRHGINYGRKVL